MISYLLVVEQHRTQIVIHALLKCQQENLYHEQRSEERFSRNAETDVVCRLLLVKKKVESSFIQPAVKRHFEYIQTMISSQDLFACDNYSASYMQISFYL